MTQATLTPEWCGRLAVLCLQLCLFFAATAMVSPAQEAQPTMGSVKFTTLVNFDGTNGSIPVEVYPAQDTDGNLYGTTESGGTNSGGTVWKMTPSGALTALYNFCSLTNCADGFTPDALVQATDGNFYGVTVSGGSSTNCYPANCGTVFSLSVGLGPFVETLPTSGKVGAQIKILGTDLTDATSVSFSGVEAPFTIVSPTLISATVPESATTGFVTVSVGNTILKSNVKFQVRP